MMRVKPPTDEELAEMMRVLGDDENVVNHRVQKLPIFRLKRWAMQMDMKFGQTLPCSRYTIKGPDFLMTRLSTYWKHHIRLTKMGDGK